MSRGSKVNVEGVHGQCRGGLRSMSRESKVNVEGVHGQCRGGLMSMSRGSTVNEAASVKMIIE